MNGRLSGTGAPPSLARRANGPGVGVGVGEVDPAINKLPSFGPSVRYFKAGLEALD